MAHITVDRPDMPSGYGVPDSSDGLLSWDVVEDRLRESEHFWLATVRPDGRPHVVPRWGAWLDGRFWYDGSPETRHARNLAANSACSLHLESGSDVVIIEGTSGPSDPATETFGERLSRAFCAKYASAGYSPEPDAWSDEAAGGLSVLTPLSAMAWQNFPTDVTRFRFGTE